MATFNPETMQIDLTQEDKECLGICISCDEVATHANNTLCLECWANAEGIE